MSEPTTPTDRNLTKIRIVLLRAKLSEVDRNINYLQERRRTIEDAVVYLERQLQEPEAMPESPKTDRQGEP